MVSSGRKRIEKFNGESFELPKLEIEDVLVDKGQWIKVDSGTKPTTLLDEESTNLHGKAKSTISLRNLDLVFLLYEGRLRRRLCGTC